MIPVAELTPHQRRVQAKLEAGISGVFAHRKNMSGREVFELEEHLALYTFPSDSITYVKRHDALQSALIALLPSGDKNSTKVLIPPMLPYLTSVEPASIIRNFHAAVRIGTKTLEV